MSKKVNNIPKNTPANTPQTVWIKNRNVDEYKHRVSSKFEKQLRILQRKNTRLISKVASLMIRKQDLQEYQIKYFELKTKLLDTELKLLSKGIDTSKYSVFQSINEEDKVTPVENKFEALIECKVDMDSQELIVDNSMEDIYCVDLVDEDDEEY